MVDAKVAGWELCPILLKANLFLYLLSNEWLVIFWAKLHMNEIH